MGRRSGYPWFFYLKKAVGNATTAFFVPEGVKGEMSYGKSAKDILLGAFLSITVMGMAAFVASAAHASVNDIRVAEEQYHLARSLERRGNFYDAVTEYKRFLFFLPREKRVPLILYRLVRCYYELHDWQNVLKYGDIFLDKYPTHPLKINVKLLEAKVFINIHEPRKALEILNDIKKRNEKLDPDTMNTLVALLGRCYVLEGKFSEAEKLAGNEVETIAGSNMKNPWIAGASAAFLPGLGHIYDDRHKDAWSAFFYTGILSAITWEAVNNDNLWLAAVSGSAASAFYAGNIFSAVNMAYKHNRRIKATRLNNYFCEKSGDIFVDYGLIPVSTSGTGIHSVRRGRSNEKKSPFSWMFLAGISVFRKMVSPVDNKHCPSYPSCSSYGLLAFRRHGAFWGTLLTIDRLIHEPSEAKLSPYIIIRGKRKIYDPLEANDFLLRHNSKNK